jgi:type VI secretion system protein ImpM
MPVSRALFGKVQTRRDFIAVETPRAFLSVWEQWLQNGVAASREALAGGWNEAFLTAPIWRFWLGENICGATTMGAIMPSMDGVGRYFPLTYAAFAEGEATLAPPEADAQSLWFDEVENFLLSTLDSRDHEALLRSFRDVAPPKILATDALRERLVRLGRAASMIAVDDMAFERSFASSREADAARAAASSTFWWTAGGEGYAPCALACLNMPSPHLFAAMLTGRFQQGAQQVEARI